MFSMAVCMYVCIYREGQTIMADIHWPTLYVCNIITFESIDVKTEKVIFRPLVNLKGIQVK